MASERDWTLYTIPGVERASDRIMFVDPNTGWISSFFPGVIKTEDGGKTWSRQNSNLAQERISSVWFTTRDRGWAIGTSYSGARPHAVILLSEDGGRSWAVQQQFVGQAVQLADVWFLDMRHGWVVGSQDGIALILATSDGGQSWQKQYQSGSFDQLTRVRFANSQIGWAVGVYGIVHTADGGTHWSAQYQDERAVALNDLTVLSADEAWAVGGWGELLHTNDRGASWSRIGFPGASDVFLWAVAFADRAHGWVCGAKGAILSTSDGGRNWDRERSLSESVLGAIAATANRVFITAGPSEILVQER